MPPLIIAHRGASAYAPENTLAAFQLAHRMHADMIELDVQATADGQLVVFHDDTTVRWDGRDRPVCACTLADMHALDIGGEQVPTLEECCAFAREYGIALNVELKQIGIGAQATALLRTYDLAEHTVISSFYEAALRELREVAPDFAAGYLMGQRTYRPNIRLREAWPIFALRNVDARAWHPAWELPLIDQLIPLIRRAGYAVNVWTVDDPVIMRRMVACGATGIITNKPDLAREVLIGR